MKERGKIQNDQFSNPNIKKQSRKCNKYSNATKLVWGMKVTIGHVGYRTRAEVTLEQ